MSLKAELEAWAAALKAYDEEDFDKALEQFSQIADTSKILCNIGLIYATLGEHEAAVEQFIEATRLDQYLAVAYFQCGVSNFLLGRYELAHKDFDEALLYLRGNQSINYEQLGLKFKLFSAEVLFNKGLTQIYMGSTQEGLADMEEARREKATDEHNVIDDAIQDRGEGYTVFSIPVGVLYRPSDSKLKNAKTKDYMGKAKLVAASDVSDSFTEFTGVTRLKQGVTPSGTFVDAPAEVSLGRSNTVPAPRNVVDDIAPRAGAALARSKTTLNVPPDARERIAALSPGGPPSASPAPGRGLARSNTSISPAAGNGLARSNTMGTPAARMGGPVRGLSVRKSPAVASKLSPTALSPTAGAEEFYDDYLDSYGGEESPSGPPSATGGGGGDRIAAWARTSAANSNAPMGRSQSTRAPPSSYAPSSFGGSSGSMRRKVTRRTMMRAPSVRAPSIYEPEEEEGYVSGEYDDGPFELIKIRVKLHYRDDVRGMALTPETSFEEFLSRVTAKFDRSLTLKFKDEDGGRISLRDDSDYELAIETARESARGKPEGKLEIWCEDK